MSPDSVARIQSSLSMRASNVIRQSWKAYQRDRTRRGVAQVQVGDQYSRVTTESEGVFGEVRKAFSFLNPSFWFMRGRFGGSSAAARFATQTAFISDKGKFPTGILEDVLAKLESMGVDVELKDERICHYEDLTWNPVSSEIFASSGVTLHDYQADIANLALEKRRGIVKCATGGGKTMIFTAILKALDDRYPAMMICRNKTVVNQTYEAFKHHGLEHVGRVHMDYTEPDIITCITAQSLHKVEALIPRTKVLLVDEVHEWASKNSQMHLKLFTNTTHRLGFSATPWNGDPVHDLKLKSWIGPELCDVGIDYLRDQRILSSCHAHFYRVSVPKERLALSPTFFNSEEIGIVENEHLQAKIAEIVSNIKEGRILILVRRLSHGDRLKELMPEAHWIRGEDNAETREFVLQQLRQSESPKVVAIMSAIGFYGLNVLCHHLINACGGKDANLLIQKVGRGLRKGIDKSHLEYHDFIFEGDRFLMRHSKARVDVLKHEGHEVTVDGNPHDLAPKFQSGSL